MTYDQLQTMLDAHKDEKLAIELQQVPDPDALSSAKVIYDLAQKHGLMPSITHAYPLSHKSNVLLSRKMDIPLVLHEDADVGSFDSSFYVDHSGGTSPWARSGKIAKPIGIIDYHDLSREVQAEYLDRQKVGATASLISFYLEQGAMSDLYKSKDEREIIATGLHYGIKTDTANFTRNLTKTDKDALKYLDGFFNSNLLVEIENPKWSQEWFDKYAYAIQNRRTNNGVTLADVGQISREDRDVLAMIADSLLQEKSVDTAYVFGIHDHIDVSIRTEDAVFDYDGLGEKFEGNGGGKEGSAGMQIPLPTGFGADVDKLESLIRIGFEEKIFGDCTL